jgi:division protein CdvB (Snf7/Vps24/ESCRT-III family)
MSNKVSDFVKGWSGRQEPTIGERIRNAFKSQEPLRYRLAMAHYKLRAMLNKLDIYIGRLQERDRILFERVVEAHMSKDTARASMYANEVAEIRKISKQLIATQIALEQVELRLETFTELGDVFSNLIPVIGVVKELRNAMRGVMPEMGLELAELEESLQSIVVEAGEFTGGGLEYVGTSPEARKILDEAAVLANQRMKEKFPELPTYATTVSQSQTSPK